MIEGTVVGIILRTELRALRNRLVKRGTGRLVVLAVFLAIAAIFIGGAAFSIGGAVGHFLPMARDPILAGGFTALSVLMLVVGFPTVIATFFVGRDLLQLVLAPVRPLDIFVARALLAMSANILVSAILLASVLGVGAGSGAPPAYYVFAVVLVINQVLVITALQAVLMSIVLRWVPARVARDVAAAVAGLTGAGLYITWNVSLRQSFSPRRNPDLTNLTALVQRIDWLPSAWPGHALSAVIDGNVGTALTWGALTLACGVPLVVVAEVLYARTLMTGLGVFGSVPMLWRRGNRRAVRDERRGAGSPLRGIARKDWLGYRRDIRRLSRLLPALLFPIGYAFAFARPSGGSGGFWSEVFLIAFVSMFMSTALGTPSIPSEKRGFQLLRMSPLPMWQVIRAKIVLTLPPILLLTGFFAVVVGVATGAGISTTLTLVGLALWLGCGFVAIGVSAGGIDPNFEATDDRRSVGLVGTLSGLGASLGFGLLSLAALALLQGAVAVIGGATSFGPVPATPALGAAAALVAVVLGLAAAGLVWFLTFVANTRLSRYEAAINATS